MNEDCIFCKILKKEIPTELVYEDDLAVAFRDIFPVASTHILIIPKEHITSINELTEEEKREKLMGRLVMIARKLAKEEGIDEKGYKLLIRTGKEGGQEVPHIHLHLMGGDWKVKPNI